MTFLLTGKQCPARGESVSWVVINNTALRLPNDMGVALRALYRHRAWDPVRRRHIRTILDILCILISRERSFVSWTAMAVSHLLAWSRRTAGSGRSSRR